MRKNLKILHSLKFIHGDIKPDNISWSGKKQKFVLLDFGFARPVKQDIGYFTLTKKYFGTYSYSSNEMQKLFMLKSPLYVDLYFNDLCGLIKSENLFKLFMK